MANLDRNKPNIVFILTDDQGSWAMGCAGNHEIKTPNIDRLAETGVRFENFFCTSPVCGPARASLLTGKIPSQHGVHDFTIGGIENDAVDFLQGHLTYSELLDRNGYYCGITGKWGLGERLHNKYGFKHWYNWVWDGGHYYNCTMIRNGEIIKEPENAYLTDLITDDALRFIEERNLTEQPFYLSVHYTAPHHLWVGEHPKVYTDMYQDCPFDSCPQETEHPWYLEISNPESVRTDPNENLKGYFASVTAMDYNVGRIIEKLDELGIRENTLICFFGDNGMNCGHHGIWGKGNGTFPQNMYDTSIKVPAIMNQPGRINQNVICDELLSGYDFMPTLLDYVGITAPNSKSLPGKSFLPLLNGQADRIREHVVVYDEYGPVRMIRTKEYKYVHRYPYGPHELFDLIKDPDERVNLVDDLEKQDIVSSMLLKMESWFNQYVVPELDGVRQPVTGSGQMNLIGPQGKGKSAFSQAALKYKK